MSLTFFYGHKSPPINQPQTDGGKMSKRPVRTMRTKDRRIGAGRRAVEHIHAELMRGSRPTLKGASQYLKYSCQRAMMNDIKEYLDSTGGNASPEVLDMQQSVVNFLNSRTASKDYRAAVAKLIRDALITGTPHVDDFGELAQSLGLNKGTAMKWYAESRESDWPSVLDLGTAAAERKQQRIAEAQEYFEPALTALDDI